MNKNIISANNMQNGSDCEQDNWRSSNSTSVVRNVSCYARENDKLPYSMDCSPQIKIKVQV